MSSDSPSSSLEECLGSLCRARVVLLPWGSLSMGREGLGLLSIPSWPARACRGLEPSSGPWDTSKGPVSLLSQEQRDLSVQQHN